MASVIGKCPFSMYPVLLKELQGVYKYFKDAALKIVSCDEMQDPFAEL